VDLKSDSSSSDLSSENSNEGSQSSSVDLFYALTCIFSSLLDHQGNKISDLEEMTVEEGSKKVATIIDKAVRS
jgi:hypothetical protein